MTEVVNPLPDELEAIAVEVARKLEASLEDIVERWYRRMASIPQLVSWRRPDIREVVLPHAQIDIARELAGLLSGRRLPERCPEEVADSARLAATSGLPLWAMLQVYRAGHAEQWQAWSDAVEGRQLQPSDRQALLQAGSEYFFAYADRCMRWAELEYTQAREGPLRLEEQRRVQLVRHLLEGRGGDTADLGYDLSRWHLGLIATGPGARLAVTALAARVGAAVLAVAAETASTWIWLGLDSHLPEIPSRVGTLALPEGSSLAVGEPHHGRSGFRLSHVQAQIAAAIGARLGRARTLYADVALEDLAGQDRERARAFCERELGPLAKHTREAIVLRETLMAYFASSQRASSAGMQLGVHERTIGNRLRRVEHLTGSTVSARRVELEVALRLHALLGE